MSGWPPAIALDSLGLDAQAALPRSSRNPSGTATDHPARPHTAAAFVRLAARSQPLLPILLKAVFENPIEESPYFGGREEYHLRRQTEIPVVVAIDALGARGPEIIPLLIESLKEDRGFDTEYRDYLSNLTVSRY